MPAEGLRTILDGLSERLKAAITVAGMPQFTASFGVVEAQLGEDLPGVLARADAALFQAKREGRARTIVHDAAGNTIPAPNRPTGTDRFTLLQQLGFRDPAPAADGA